MTAARRFPNDAIAVKAARQFALESLADRSLELLEMVELLVSELASNCVRHTDSAFEVKISSDPSQIHISVTDSGSGRPEMQRFDPTAVSGRGLALVEMLSNSWGVSPSEPTSSGKTVWFVLDVADQPFRPASTTHANDTTTTQRSDRQDARGAPMSRGGKIQFRAVATANIAH